MPAFQDPVHPVVAERTRRILSACRYARTAEDYARRLVAALATEISSEHAVWLDASGDASAVIAQSEDSDILLSCLRSMWEDASMLCNNVESGCGIASIAAAPMLFRNSVAGVLAVANGDEPYSATDLEVLRECGRIALADYESLLRAEALGMPNARRSIAEFVHELRQPLSIMEACAYYLGLILTSDSKAHAQVLEMQRQLESAGRMLDKGTGGYGRRRACPELPVEIEGEDDPDPESNRVLIQSAMSLVT